VEITKDEDAMLCRGTPVFLDGMVSRSGEEYSSFLKVDPETGRMSYSKTLEGFDEKPSFKIPDEVWGVKLKTTEKARLQDGKAVQIIGMKGYDGKEFSSWLKVNSNQARLDYYPENPDKPRHGEGQATAQTATPDSKQQPETSKSASKQTVRQDDQKQLIKDVNKRDQAQGFRKKVNA